MLGDLWGGMKDFLGDTLSSILESILNATIYKLCYYIERILCWIVGILTDLFNVFAGLEPATYNGSKDYLINIFFSNKAINNIYWGMAVIGMILVIAFAGWAVIRKMFDLSGKQQQSLGQIIWSAIRSIILITGMTLVISVVLSATGILMQQVDFIFNNAYHLEQPQERDFSEEEYAAMGRVLATVGNYAAVPNSNNRYNLNACFNNIRADMYFLQQQGVFEYSYYHTEGGQVVESWQSVLSQIAKSTDLRQEVMMDVYNEGVAKSITAAMDYLRNTANPVPVDHVKSQYVVTERAHLDRMIFLMGTMRAAKNSAYNEHPAFDDALRGAYYYEDGKSIYSFSDVNSDFEIGFEMDYILVWLAAMAIIVDLVIVILNCIARIFNMLMLYIIAPPIIAVSPLDNGGKFKQWTTAFLVQSLSVFGTVIAMRLLLIYLPIVCSPQLVLFEKPLLNALAKFMLVYGGIEAAKKSTAILTGILADSAGWQSVQAGDMTTSANRMVGRAADLTMGAVGMAAGVAGSTLNFATKPLQNVAGRAWGATGGKLAEAWKNLGKGDAEGQKAMSAAKERLATEKAYAKLTGGDSGSGGGKSGGSPGGGSSGSSGGGRELPNQQQQSGTQEGGEQGGGGPQKEPPPLPQRYGGSRSSDAESGGNARADSYRESRGFSRPGSGDVDWPGPRDDSRTPSTRNRPTLEGSGPRQAPPAGRQENAPNAPPRQARPPQGGEGGDTGPR